MEALSPFLIGGPAYSGTTLLALLCNQPGVVCLDEPDFEKTEQSHRGIPVLQRLCPESTLPAAPTRDLTPDEAFDLVRACAVAVRPTTFGFKTCGETFVSFARLFRDAGLPVVAIVRDIRDALVRPLPPWSSEESLNAAYRSVWKHLGLTSTWIRYEDLVRDPTTTMARVATALGHEAVHTTWDPTDVPGAMLKLDRHELLRSGAISSTRVGIWRQPGVTFSRATHETARMMGYDH
jgi:hypothetical protein